MKDAYSVVNIGRYGHVTVHLKELIEQKGLTRYRVAKLANTRFEVVDKWCSGKVDRIDADILAKFCFILDCRIEDILSYHPDHI